MTRTDPWDRGVLDCCVCGASLVPLRRGLRSWGMINLTRAALPVLHRQRADHIILFTSIGCREGSPALGAYQLSMFAVAGSPRLAAEVPPLGIKVAIIKPGGFRTDWAGPRCRPRRALDPTTSGPSGR